MNDDKPLTDKQRALVDHYLGAARMDPVQAAKLAGYTGQNKTLSETANRILDLPAARVQVEQYFDKTCTNAGEILALLTDYMRADIGDFFDIIPPGRVAILNLEKAKERGKLHLIKSLWYTQQGPRLELHDPMKAAELLGKALRLWVERVQEEHTGEVRVTFCKPEGFD